MALVLSGLCRVISLEILRLCVTDNISVMVLKVLKDCAGDTEVCGSGSVTKQIQATL